MTLVIGQVHHQVRPQRDPDSIAYVGERMAVVVDTNGVEHHIHDKQRRYLDNAGPIVTFNNRRGRYLSYFPPKGTWVVMEVPPDYHAHGKRPEAIAWCDLKYYRKKWHKLFGREPDMVPHMMQPAMQRYLESLIEHKQHGELGEDALVRCGGWISASWRQLGLSRHIMELMALHFIEDVPAKSINTLFIASGF